MPPKNEDNIKKLGERLKELAAQMEAKNKTVTPSQKTTTISDLVAEGNRLLAEDEKKQPVPVEAPVSTVNPYLQARRMVLKKMPEWRQREIATMEKNGNLDNSHYTAFVKEVAEQGDKLSS